VDIKKLLLGGAAVVAAGFVVKKALTPEPPGLAQSQKIIDGLDSSLRPMAVALLYAANNKGIPLVVTSGYRSIESQQKIWNQGRTTPGRIVTHAEPGNSWHNYGLAFDVAVLKDDKATWPENPKLWNRIGAIGKALGLSWGGDFPGSQKDLPHFGHHPRMRIVDAKSGKRPRVA